VPDQSLDNEKQSPTILRNCGLTVFAVVEEATGARECLTLAALASRARPQSTIVALHIQVDPNVARIQPEEISLQRMREANEGTSAERARQVRRIFDYWAATEPSIHAVWKENIGSVEPTLRAVVAGADLIVIAQPHNLDGTDAFHAAIFGTGKLVLFVPHHPSRTQRFGQHLAIAWNGSPPAFNAVQKSLPWLCAADKVSVLSAHKQGHASNIPDITPLLVAHGIAPSIRNVRLWAGESAGHELLKAADEIGADALVMGAYRFGMVVEWLLGGASRDILEQSVLPIFMAH
jgi:nucleotide-binding universal stress UspA family protein